MRIITKDIAICKEKPEGTKIWYYLFSEYEIHYNEQPAHSIQVWHKHNVVNETIFIIKGELVAMWTEKGEQKEKIVCAGDLVLVDDSDHTFENRTNYTTKFLALKNVLSGKDKSEIFKNDKVLGQNG